MNLYGLRVVESLAMTEPKNVRGWYPCGGGWLKHVERTIQVPRRDTLIAGDVLYIHPAMMPELRKRAREERRTP